MRQPAEIERRKASPTSEPARGPEDEAYRYEHSGITERHGEIPLWLVLVTIALLAWGVYYTIKYWNTS
jgi:hypothetical protein